MIVCGGFVLRLKFEIYLMKLKHIVTEHFKVMSVIIHDMKDVGDNLRNDLQILATIRSLMNLIKP